MIFDTVEIRFLRCETAVSREHAKRVRETHFGFFERKVSDTSLRTSFPFREIFVDLIDTIFDMSESLVEEIASFLLDNVESIFRFFSLFSSRVEFFVDIFESLFRISETRKIEREKVRSRTRTQEEGEDSPFDSFQIDRHLFDFALEFRDSFVQ